MADWKALYRIEILAFSQKLNALVVVSQGSG